MLIKFETLNAVNIFNNKHYKVQKHTIRNRIGNELSSECGRAQNGMFYNKPRYRKIFKILHVWTLTLVMCLVV